MIKEDILIWTLVIALLSFFVAVGFVGGRHYERKFWIKYLPGEMEKICLECSGMEKELHNFVP